MTDTPTYGQQEPTDDGSQFNALSFIARQLISRINTSGLVKVIAVHGGGLAAVGTVDVQPMVNQIDGAGNGTPHGTIYGLPYIRIQGGTNAIIIDPVIDDIGEAVYCSTDISTVKTTGDVSNPASFRRFSMADGLYLGGTLNQTPTQYVWLKPDGGIVAVSTGNISLTDGTGSNLTLNNDNTGSVTMSGLFTINASTKIIGPLEVTEATTLDTTLLVKGAVTGDSTADFSGEVTANGGHTVSAHIHTQGIDSHGDVEQPTNPPTG